MAQGVHRNNSAGSGVLRREWDGPVKACKPLIDNGVQYRRSFSLRDQSLFVVGDKPFKKRKARPFGPVTQEFFKQRLLVDPETYEKNISPNIS